MKVKITDYYAGALTKADFINVVNWETGEADYLVSITFKDVSSIEKVGDGLRIVFDNMAHHYFDFTDYKTITIF